MDTPTLIDIPAPKPRENVWLWLFKIIAGLVIVVLLGVHFIVNHLVAPNGLLSYADVIRYYSNPFIPVMEIAFLVFVISHALVGMRGILLDLNPSDQILRWIDLGLLVVGLAALIYGVGLVLVIASRGTAPAP